MEQNGDRRNQLLLREVNKRIREVSDGLDQDGRAEFLCECGREECTATFLLARPLVDDLFDDESRMLLASTHRPSVDGRQIVAEHERFLVVAEP